MKEYILRAGRNWKFLCQKLTNEQLVENEDLQVDVLLHADLGLKKGDLVKVTIEKVTKEMLESDALKKLGEKNEEMQ
jgi:hypothetical protein